MITQPQVQSRFSFTHSPSIMHSNMYVLNVALKQHRQILSNLTLQPSMMKNDFSVMNAITKVLLNNHYSFTHSPSMMGSDMHVMNVATKQLRNILSNLTWQPSTQCEKSEEVRNILFFLLSAIPVDQTQRLSLILSCTLKTENITKQQSNRWHLNHFPPFLFLISRWCSLTTS